MFVATPGNQVIAIDAKTGGVLWRYRRPLPEDVILLHATSRGVAFIATRSSSRRAKRCWSPSMPRPARKSGRRRSPTTSKGYYMSLAPLIADGKVMVGASGGELGVRGFVAAYDAETGAQLWKTHTVPAPGEPGSETWPKGDQWKTGGGSVWVTGTYDPETNLAFWGTGNGGPWMGDQRPGDNLYTSSTVALDVATGEIKGHFQYHPNESWDWDEVSPPILVDYQRNGRTVKGLINVARNGYLWFLERTTGRINFVEGMPFVKQNVFKSLDPKTGRPDVDPARQPGTGKAPSSARRIWGGKNWPPIAFSPRDADDLHPGQRESLHAILGRAGHLHARPALHRRATRSCSPPAPITSAKCRRGTWTPASACGRTTSRHSANWGPMLATAGGLVFSGGTNDRLFRAFDASTGKVLWEFPTNSGIIGQPSSFMVDGKQYIAVQSGWGIDARAMQARLNRLIPGSSPRCPKAARSGCSR